jgi:hypothetical protein
MEEEDKFPCVYPPHMPEMKYQVDNKDFLDELYDPGAERARQLAFKWKNEGKRTMNQYTSRILVTGEQSVYSEEKLIALAVYIYILITAESVPSAVPMMSKDIQYNCWISSSDRERISYMSGKIFNYVYTATMIWDRAPEGLEWSHICHIVGCVRPTHLNAETHKINMDRNRCPGFICLTEADLFWKVCTHDPTCLHHQTISIKDSNKISDYY